MSDKSYVTVEQHVCGVCCTAYDTGSILFDSRMRERFDHTTVTGIGLCAECKKKDEEGFVALVAVSNVPADGKTMRPEDAERTGDIVHLRRTAARRVFNVPVPDDVPVMFVEPGVIEALKKMAPPA